MLYIYTILNLECCMCARMRFHCANGLVVLLICAVAHLKGNIDAYRNMRYIPRNVSVRLHQWFLTFLIYLTLLLNQITRFTPNTLNGAHLLKIRKKHLLQFRMIHKNLHWLRCMVQSIYRLEDEFYPQG